MDPMGPQGPPMPMPEGAPMPPPMMPTPGPGPGSSIAPSPGPSPDMGPGAYGGEPNYDSRPTTDEVGYDWGDCCSTCVHFMAPEGCEVVNGHIRCDGWCSLYSQRPGLPSATGEEYDPYSRPMDVPPSPAGPAPTGPGPTGPDQGMPPTGPPPMGPPPGPLPPGLG